MLLCSSRDQIWEVLHEVEVTHDLLLVTVILMVSGPVLAHHGSGVSYDLTKVVTMEGTVTEFQWRNPHVYVMYDVKNSLSLAEGRTGHKFLASRVEAGLSSAS